MTNIDPKTHRECAEKPDVVPSMWNDEWKGQRNVIEDSGLERLWEGALSRSGVPPGRARHR